MPALRKHPAVNERYIVIFGPQDIFWGIEASLNTNARFEAARRFREKYKSHLKNGVSLSDIAAWAIAYRLKNNDFSSEQLVTLMNGRVPEDEKVGG